jgi:NTP pyrophosphatase (non-canonical NTP hydrolase)
MDIRPIDASALQEELQWLKQQAGSTNEDTYNDMMYRVCNLPTLSLNTMRDAIYEDAVAHGLWEEVEKDSCELSEEEPPSEREAAYTFHRRVYAIKEVYFECDEALTAAEEEDWDGLQEELADVVIMAMSAAGYLGIDIDAAIRRKMEINKARPWKHEGEKK